MISSESLIITSLRRTRRMFVIATLITIPTALFMLVAGPLGDESTGITVACIAIGAVFLATGVFLARMTWQHWDPHKAPLMRVLRERPGAIVWIYVEEISGQAAGVTVKRNFNIKIALADKKVHTLAVKPEHKERVLEILAAYSPQATIGFSRDRQKQYRRDPASLASHA